MDFTPTTEQSAAGALAAEIFADLSTPERLAAVGSGSDPELWKALCAAGLPEAVEETGLLGLVLLLEEQGRRTAQVPFAASCVHGLLAVSLYGTEEQRERLLPALREGSEVAIGSLDGAGRVTAEGGRLSGEVPWVPWLRESTLVLLADTEGVLWLVPVAGAGAERVELTAPWSAGRLVLRDTPAERLGAPPGAEGVRRPGFASPAEHLTALARIAFAGLQAGVCAGALARTVEHVNSREQFGRPLAVKQGVQLRAADAHMDTESIRVTAYEAAWRHDAGLPCAAEALTAAWWASEAGRRVVHACQHLHGGTGADVTHPVHRHFLWGRQLDAYLGSGGELLEELGELLASGAVGPVGPVRGEGVSGG